VRRLLADENFDGRVLRALLRLIPELDVVRVQDTHLSGARDPEVLTWAAEEDRIILTHDVATMTRYGRERVISGQPMPGLVAVRTDRSLGRVIDDLELLLLASGPHELVSRIVFVPL
jgi:predicted nuclease of predicted toxin-antitoxin system